MLSKLFGSILRLEMLLTLLDKYGDVTELIVLRGCTLTIYLRFKLFIDICE